MKERERERKREKERERKRERERERERESRQRQNMSSRRKKMFRIERIDLRCHRCLVRSLQDWKAQRASRARPARFVRG